MEISQDIPKANSEQCTSSPAIDQPSSFIIFPNDDFSTSIEALLAFEKAFPFLQLLKKITNKIEYILKAKDSATFYILQNTRVLSSGKTINLCAYRPSPKKTRMVLEGYPLGFSLNHLQENPLIESASCLLARPSRKETRLVLDTILGELLNKPHLGFRFFYPSWVKCGKCQCSDHQIFKCRGQAHCGVCAEPHRHLHQETYGGETHHSKVPKL